MNNGNGDWIGQALKGMMGFPSGYENRKLGRKEQHGLIISTCWTDEFGYETAVLDKNGAHPVERYDTEELAQIGHDKWVNKTKTLKYITKLGTPDGLVDDKKVLLVRLNAELPLTKKAK